MLIVADENMPLVDEYFGAVGEIRKLPGREMSAADVRDADVLLVRSVTRVNKALLNGSRVRFVGTATIGRDHVDEAYLASAGVVLASAPGCNARAVAEYVVAALLEAELSVGSLEGRVLGIVGLGNVGRQLATLAPALGVSVIGCDPFVQEAPVPLVSFDELLSQSDLVSLHLPLSVTGPYPTRHLFDSNRLKGLREQTVLVNSSRGAVVDNQALLDVLSVRNDLWVALDVWEGEPSIRQDLFPHLKAASPHVAGYTQEGKWRGTRMVYEAFCQFAGLECREVVTQGNPRTIQIPMEGSLRDRLRQVVRSVYDIRRDGEALRQSLLAPDPVREFDRLRRDYPERREFSAYIVPESERSADLGQQLAGLGFSA